MHCVLMREHTWLYNFPAGQSWVQMALRKGETWPPHIHSDPDAESSTVLVNIDTFTCFYNSYDHNNSMLSLRAIRNKYIYIKTAHL